MIREFGSIFLCLRLAQKALQLLVFLVKAFGRTIFLQRFSAIFVLGLCD